MLKLISKIKRLFIPKKRIKVEISKEELIDGFKSTQALSTFIRELEQQLYEEYCNTECASWVYNIHDKPICSKCGCMANYDIEINDYKLTSTCPGCNSRMV